VRADFIQDLVRKEIVSIHKIDSTDNPADNGTKLVYAYQWQSFSRYMVGAPPKFISGTNINLRYQAKIAKESKKQSSQSYAEDADRQTCPITNLELDSMSEPPASANRTRKPPIMAITSGTQNPESKSPPRARGVPKNPRGPGKAPKGNKISGVALRTFVISTMHEDRPPSTPPRDDDGIISTELPVEVMPDAYLTWSGKWAGYDFSKRYEHYKFTDYGIEPDPDPTSYYDPDEECIEFNGDFDRINEVLEFYGHPYAYYEGDQYQLPLQIGYVSDSSFLWADHVDQSTSRPFYHYNWKKKKGYHYEYWHPRGLEHPMKWHHYNPAAAALIFTDKFAIKLRNEEFMRDTCMYSPVSSDDDADPTPVIPRTNAVPNAPYPAPLRFW
jgi:hypothetical protein